MNILSLFVSRPRVGGAPWSLLVPVDAPVLVGRVRVWLSFWAGVARVNLRNNGGFSFGTR